MGKFNVNTISDTRRAYSNKDVRRWQLKVRFHLGFKYLDFLDFDGAVWLEPKLVCCVQFMERTHGGGLRQPVFRGLRDDKAPNECVI